MKNKLPTILTCLSAVGMIFTTVSAVKATPKAIKLVDEATLKKLDDLTPVEIVKTTWKCYVPAALFATGTLICMFGANSLSRVQQASLASAYALMREKYTDYVRKNKEIFGEENHKRILQELTVEKAKDICIDAPNCFYNSHNDFEGYDEEKVLFYENFSGGPGRYFEATISQVLLAEYHLNRNFSLGWIPCVNDFYNLVGLEKTEYGDKVGWSNATGEYFWIDFNHIRTDIGDGMVCYIIDTPNPPNEDYLEE